MSVLNRMKRSVEELEAETKKLGSNATLSYLRTGPTVAIDITGTLPEPYLEALLEGVQSEFTAAVRTRDNALPKRLLAHGAKVWVGPHPDADEHYTLLAYQEDGTLAVQLRGAEPERKWWRPGDGSGSHTFKLGSFARYDDQSVASSLASLSSKQRAKMERRIDMSPAELVRNFAVLMTLTYTLLIGGGVTALLGVGLTFWQLAQDGPLTPPLIMTNVGILIGLSSRLVINKINAFIGTDRER